MFDITRNLFCVTFRLLRLFLIIDIIRSKTIQRHVWPPDIVPALKFFAEKGQMIKVFNDRYKLEPFVLQGFDDSLCDGNCPMFSYSSKAWLHIPVVQQLCKSTSYENLGLIRDNMLWRTMFLNSISQSLNDPP